MRGSRNMSLSKAARLSTTLLEPTNDETGRQSRSDTRFRLGRLLPHPGPATVTLFLPVPVLFRAQRPPNNHATHPQPCHFVNPVCLRTGSRQRGAVQSTGQFLISWHPYANTRCTWPRHAFAKFYDTCSPRPRGVDAPKADVCCIFPISGLVPTSTITSDK